MGRKKFLYAWFLQGLEKRESLEKWEVIFQSGKSQGILIRLGRSGNFTQNTGKINNLINEKSWGNENVCWLLVLIIFFSLTTFDILILQF